ncbi:MAG: proline dehydrogenase [Rhodothermales bacterium]|nr:proline dehydrogenase [Rhodothermales bacterium]
MKLPFRLASRFVASDSLDGTLPVLSELKSAGLHTTLDLLGEYVTDRNVAARARDEFIKLIDRLSDEHERTNVDRNISIKLSMMGQKIDESFCLDNLKQVLSQAKKKGVFIRLDMEGTDITDSTLGLFETVYPEYPENVGVVLQAYLKRTRKDIERMCELKARVRLCKGAYKEPAHLAHQRMSDIREAFIEYMKMLIADARYPGIATHDDILIDATKTWVAENGVDNDRFEFQMLYGMRPSTQKNLADAGYNMRVYVPYGKDWVPYFTRRLRERKENVWFVLRTLIKS